MNLNLGRNTGMFKQDLELQRNWQALLSHLERLVGKRPKDLNAVLFIIGMQELGQGPKRFTKEEKQDLMHIAICKALSLSGYYHLEGLDKDGWPHWKLIKKLLKMHALEYFEKEYNWKFDAENPG